MAGNTNPFSLGTWDPNNPLAGLAPISMGNYTDERNMSQKAQNAALSGMTYGQSSGDSGYDVSNPYSAYFTSSNGTRLNTADGTTFSDTYDSPGGAGHKLDVQYKYDPATGMATPTSANDRYQGSNWVEQYRTPAAILATVLAAGAGGAALAGAGEVGAGTGAAATGGGLSSADTAALYGAEGYGSTGLASSAPAYGGVGTAGAGAGTDAIIGTNGAALTGGSSTLADLLKDGAKSLVSKGMTGGSGGTGQTNLQQLMGGGAMSAGDRFRQQTLADSLRNGAQGQTQNQQMPGWIPGG